jgi:hypothetical protein
VSNERKRNLLLISKLVVFTDRHAYSTACVPTKCIWTNTCSLSIDINIITSKFYCTVFCRETVGPLLNFSTNCRTCGCRGFPRIIILRCCQPSILNLRLHPVPLPRYRSYLIPAYLRHLILTRRCTVLSVITYLPTTTIIFS